MFSRSMPNTESVGQICSVIIVGAVSRSQIHILSYHLTQNRVFIKIIVCEVNY